MKLEERWKHEVGRQAGEMLSPWSHASRRNLVKDMHERSQGLGKVESLGQGNHEPCF